MVTRNGYRLFKNTDIRRHFENPKTLVRDIKSFIACAATQTPTRTFRSQTQVVIDSIIHDGAYLGDFCIVRNSIVGPGVIVGGHVQLNWAIVQDETELPHFNNVAFSVLGRRVLFGPGTSTCSRKLDGKRPCITLPDNSRYFSSTTFAGSLIGDDVRIGANVTINPFCIIERGSIIPPNTSVVGYYSS